MATKKSLREALNPTGSTRLDPPFVGKLLDQIEARLGPVEAKKADFEATEKLIRDVALQRINETLTPAIQQVLTIQERGFLIARSTSSAEIADGNTVLLVIDDLDERAVFTPSPRVILTREANDDDYAVVREVSYLPETGEFVGVVEATFGDPGPHSDWIIGAIAGATLSAIHAAERAAADLVQTGEDRQAVADDKAAVAGLRTAVADDKAATAVAATLAGKWATEAEDVEVSGGKFSSLHYAAKALASALAAAMFDPSSYYVKSQVYTKAETEAAFATLLSPIFAGAPTAPTQATSDNSTKLATTAFVKAVVASLVASAPGALDTLNELAAALGNDPNFATTVTNAIAAKLNSSAVSAFMLTVLDDANAAAARTTLGIGSMATRSLTVSTASPSGGTDGDVWLKV